MKTPGNQWDNVWVNCHLATMAGGWGIIENAALATKGGRIGWVGKKSDLPGKAEQVHDAKGAWITPGLTDCHTHLVYAGNRVQEFALRMEGKSYSEIAKAGGGILATVRATRAASEEELLAQSEKRLTALRLEGVTTVEIKSGYGLDLETELKMLRVARKLGKKHHVDVRTTFLGAHAVPPEYAGRADDYIEHVCNEMIPAVAREKLADAVDGFCEHIAFSAAQMEKVFAAARTHGLQLKLHAEQLSDCGGAKLAARAKALSADHLEYADEEAIRAIGAAGTVAVLLPGAFYMLRETKKPPVDSLRKHGVKMALATDCNPGTSPITSPRAIMNMACVLFGFTPEEALAGFTRNGAAALGMDKDIGTLEVGKAVDIALWDIGHPAELAYGMGQSPLIGGVKIEVQEAW